jgi:CRP/FNR family transcriptional regulator, cyclic AMP receptor protein
MADGGGRSVDTSLIEAIGYCGTLATVATYSMRSIVPLRVAGIASSLFFITYAAIMGVWPMLLSEFVILPINCWRLYQVLRTGSAAAPPANLAAST